MTTQQRINIISTGDQEKTAEHKETQHLLI